ncbi:ABC transporter permease, partial [Glaciimonas sp. CA11.2]|nr:ABC transporter permease [Glaciimonas sp. CA11.2]
MWQAIKPNYKNMRVYQALVLVIFFAAWHVVTRNQQTAFFFGEPIKVLERVWQWFTVGSGSLDVGIGDTTWFTLKFPGEIYSHLLVTLTETMLAFGIGTVLGLGVGLWLALSPLTSAILDPYIKASNAMPR